MLPPSPNPGREQIDALLAERKPDLVTIDGWRAIEGRRAIDADEVRRGREAERPRVRLSSHNELLAIAQGRR